LYDVAAVCATSAVGRVSGVSSAGIRVFKFARAIDAALTRLGALLRTPDQLTTLLFGDARGETSCSIS
jgi:hypothetical protein